MIRAGGGISREKPVGPQLLQTNIAVRCDELADTWRMGEIADLTTDIRDFANARDWAQFHDAKSLFIALTGELGEVAELIQWLPADSAAERLQSAELRDKWAAELADIATYLLRLADVTGVDLSTAIPMKLEASALRYTVELSRGNSDKR